MSKDIENLRVQKFKGKDGRLFNEWDMIDQRFEYGKDSQVEYYIKKTNGNGLPIVYEIVFNIKSIIGVREPDANGLQPPIFGKEHVLRITLPNDYPTKSPEFRFISPVWHPNVQFFGEDEIKGLCCLTFEEQGKDVSLRHYIDWLIDYLTYTDYMAENKPPYPQDLTVAKWVIEQAEPNDWLNFKQD